MLRLLILFLCLSMFSCYKADVVQYQTWNQDPATKESGLQINALQRQYNAPTGFYFLRKYDDTMWTDTENYYSDFSDIKFERTGISGYFISFFDINNNVSYCKGWRQGENTYDKIKWIIEIKRDEEDVLWFDLDYYGTSQDIEYTMTYKYEVIDGLLHFSNTEGQKFIFHPSVKNYSRELIETREIIEQEGCLFL